MTDLNELVLNTTYRDVERMLYQMCWGCVHRYGGEFEEWLSEAHLAFMNATRTYDPSRGAFTTWLWYQVRGQLNNYLRRRIRQHEMEVDTEDLGAVPNRNGRFNLEKFLVDLSEDSRTVVRLVMESPPEYYRMMSRGNVNGVKCRLWGQLKEMGWTVGEAIRSFHEIREALGGG